MIEPTHKQRGGFLRTAADLFPGYFALVMATGIISIGAYKRYPLRYDPQYWGMVFPLGMYTVCTFQLSKAINFAPLVFVPRYFIYLAMTAWLLTFLGLIHTVLFKKNS